MFKFIKNISFTLTLIYLIAETGQFSIRSTNKNLRRSTTNVEEDHGQVMIETQPNEQQTVNDNKDTEIPLVESSDDSISYPYYSYSYEVRDPATGDDKQHEEKRDGDFVQGQYSLIEPDGSRRIVAYQSNGTEGFNAIVLKIDASQLTLPMETDSSSTAESTIINPSETTSSSTVEELNVDNDCEQYFSNTSPPSAESEHHSEQSQTPEESMTYMNMEGLENEAITSNDEKVTTPEEMSAETSQVPVWYSNQYVRETYESAQPEQTDNISNRSNQPENEMEKETRFRLDENNNHDTQINYNAVPQTHIMAYPVTIMQTHLVSPVPVLLHLAPNILNSYENVQNENQENMQTQNNEYKSEEIVPKKNYKVNNKNHSTSNINKNEKLVNVIQYPVNTKHSNKSRRHSERKNSNQNGKTIKLRVSYKLDQKTENVKPQQQEMSNRKIKTIKRDGKSRDVSQ